VFGLSFLLMLLLPRGAGRHPPAPGGAGSDEAPAVQQEVRAGDPA